jgi:hypothetical protein
MAINTSKSLCFAWTGEFDSLKCFVKDNLKLKGTWTQPGGDKKVFTSEDSTSTLIWRKNKSILLIDGERAHDIMKDLCKHMCDEFDSGTSTGHVGQPSMQSCDVYEDVETLKFGQSLNSEAIQALSASVSQLSTVFAQFQSLMDEKQNRKDLELHEETQAELINITNESVEHDNHENNCSSNNANPDASNILSELVNPIVNNGISADNANNCRVSTSNDEMSAEQAPGNNDHQPTYAEATKSFPVLNNDKCNNKPEDKSQDSQSEEPPSVPEEFIGVERKRKKTKKFLLTGISKNVKDHHILSYLERRNIIPTYISVFPSRRRGTLSCKIHFQAAACSFVQDENFWPEFVSCKPWQPKKQIIKPTQDGNFSSYV